MENDVLNYPLTKCFDIEVYPNYFLCAFDDDRYFERFENEPLDTVGLLSALEESTLISFNGIAYDMPILKLALAGCTNEQLKGASDDLIVYGVRHWDLLKNWGISVNVEFDHIDLIELLPGQNSLKMYGGKLHTKTLQDLPFNPSNRLNFAETFLLREYCFNDLRITRECYEKFKPQIKLRASMGEKYGMDLRSKSDAQIAESIFKHELNKKTATPNYPTGLEFYYRPPTWVKFHSLPILELLTNPFVISKSGAVDLPKALGEYDLKIGSTCYQMGIGGLHSKETNVCYHQTTTRSLKDFDVASYYPAIMINNDIEPIQLKGDFMPIYRGWRDTRINAKHNGNKKEADMLKIVLNGTFGKLGSKYSVFYAPTELIQVTLTGQLAILMLIETLELCGISVISANTDGIVLNVDNATLWLVYDIIKNWEKLTGFETEETEYTAVYSRDVNKYIAIKTDGTVKLKGCFAPPEPVGGSWPSPTANIVNIAIIEYLTNQTPIALTVYNCKDIKQFVSVRKVAGSWDATGPGGGYFSNYPPIPKKPSKKLAASLCEQYGISEYNDLLTALAARREYLGKVVRWYYSTTSTGHIQTKAGNLVSLSETCRPLMTLPDSLPADLNYNWYISTAAKTINSFTQ